METDLGAAACAGLCCLGSWAAIAAGGAWLAHLRMQRIERELGRRALPANEAPLAFYAGASALWLSALVLAVVGLGKRDWARLGRNALLIFFAHITLVTFAAIGQTMWDATRDEDAVPLGLLIGACTIAASSFVVSAVFLARWASARAERIAAMPSHEPAREPPTVERFAVYAGSLLLWPIGLVAALVYRAPENVRVGMRALQLSAVNVLVIALLVCGAIPAIVYFAAP